MSGFATKSEVDRLRERVDSLSCGLAVVRRENEKLREALRGLISAYDMPDDKRPWPDQYNKAWEKARRALVKDKTAANNPRFITINLDYAKMLIESLEELPNAGYGIADGLRRALQG